jgi:RimJ/RimL family protein N-acetyltransferase
MAWRVTNSIEAFLDAAGDHLRTDPVVHTVPLTVLERLRLRGPSAFGDSPPLFGWHEAANGAVDGAFLQTPPHPVLVATLSPGSARCLIDLLGAEHALPGAVNVAAQDATSCLAAWAAASDGSGTVTLRTRLFRLGVLVPPEPAPPGAARIAGQADRELLIDWHAAFGAAAHGAVHEDAEATVTDRLSHRGLVLWETGGEPVAMVGLTRAVAGVVRVGTVYTPPEHRRRGYGGAITTAASRAALDAGAAAVVLFTDLANPTSNALYQRLGYRPVGDRVVLDLSTSDAAQPDAAQPDAVHPDAAHPDVTDSTGSSSSLT